MNRDTMMKRAKAFKTLDNTMRHDDKTLEFALFLHAVHPEMTDEEIRKKAIDMARD